MNRNIITNITLSNEDVSITVLEKINHLYVSIFSDTAKIEEFNTFFDKSLDMIKSKIGGVLTSVTLTIKPNKNTGGKIKVARQNIKIYSGKIIKQDITNCLEIARVGYNDNKKYHPVHIQPIEFTVKGDGIKRYSKAPINKHGSELSILYAVTLISKKTYSYVKQLFEGKKINIEKILLTPQVESYSQLNESDLYSGAMLLSIDKNDSYLSVAKQGAIVSYLKIKDFGIVKLIDEIARKFGCDKDHAEQILNVYGTLGDIDSTQIIYQNPSQATAMNFTNKELQFLIKGYFSNIIHLIKNYVNEKKIVDIPLIVSGCLNNVGSILDYAKQEYGNKLVYLHNPLSFVELDEKTAMCVGIDKFMSVMDNIMGIKYNTIVDTNPDSIMSLTKNMNKNHSTIWSKFLTLFKTGGINV